MVVTSCLHVCGFSPGTRNRERADCRRRQQDASPGTSLLIAVRLFFLRGGFFRRLSRFACVDALHNGVNIGHWLLMAFFGVVALAAFESEDSIQSGAKFGFLPLSFLFVLFVFVELILVHVVHLLYPRVWVFARAAQPRAGRLPGRQNISRPVTNLLILCGQFYLEDTEEAAIFSLPLLPVLS